MKVTELIGPALDWAVFKTEGYGWYEIDNNGYLYAPLSEERYSPATDWAQGGPIVERESISLMKDCDDIWQSSIGGCTGLDEPFWQADGSTPLIAAMRCYVASKLGDEVEVPNELKGEIR